MSADNRVGSPRCCEPGAHSHSIKSSDFMSWDTLVNRYVGHRVCVASYHQTRYWGQLRQVHPDSIVLEDAILAKETDDEGWSGYLQYSNAQDSSGMSWPEVVLRFDQVLSITCVDHDFHEDYAPQFETNTESADDSEPDADAGQSLADLKAELEAALVTDAVLLEVGMQIVSTVGQQDGFISKVKSLRQKIATEHGTVMPAIRIRDNGRLQPNEYQVLMHGRKVASGRLYPNSRMIVDPPDEVLGLEGEIAIEPVGGLPAMWVPECELDKYPEKDTLFSVDCEQVLLGHLHELFIQNAGSLLSGDDVEQLLSLASENGAWSAGRELVPGHLPLATVHRVMSALLSERIPLRPMRVIVETLAYESQFGANAECLLQAVRLALKHQIIDPHCEEPGVLRTWQLHPEVEAQLLPALADPGQWPRRVGTLSKQAQLVPQNALANLIEMLPERSNVLVVPMAIRRELRDALQGHHPRLTVVSWEEIPGDYGVLCERLIRADDLSRTGTIRRPHFSRERSRSTEKQNEE